MKTFALIITIFTLTAFTAMGQNDEINNLLQNPNTRSEIYNTIMNSHEYMSDFMESAHGNQHAMMMMRNGMMGENGQMGMSEEHHMMNNGQMMNGNNMDMKGQHQVMGMMMDNPSMMPGVMNEMMNYSEKDSTMYHRMIEVMTQHPQMMQMATNKMNHSMNTTNSSVNKK